MSAAVLGVAVSLLIAILLARKWNLGLGRVAAAVILLGVVTSPAVGLLGRLVHAGFAAEVAAVCASTLALSFLLLGLMFFRDPERIAPRSSEVVLSPADGLVVYVRRSHRGMLPASDKRGAVCPLTELTKTPLHSGEAVVVGISMSFLDVHVNRAPISGRISSHRHFPGSFGSLRKAEMLFRNERATTIIERPGLEVAVVQIASRLVRRISFFSAVGREIAMGERLGAIRLGSQVDVVLPFRDDLTVSVREGERVTAGKSVIAVMDARQAQPGRHGEAPGGALVIGGDYRGLCIARSLGRRGVPVCILAAAGELIGRTTRYLSRALPWPEGAEEQVAYLLELARWGGFGGWALFPTSDCSAELVARHHALLSPHLRLTTPTWEVARWALDKRRTYDLARMTGVDFPRTWCPVGPAQLAGHEVAFPAIIKPATKELESRLTKDRAWRVNDPASLERHYELACSMLSPELVMLQELVPGGGEAQYSVAALSRDGAPVASLTARRLRQYPPDFGRSSSFVETTERPELERAAFRLLEAIGYTGLVEVEFKRDRRDGGYKLLDINPRAWTWIALGERAGVDFPYLQWLELSGRPVPRLQAPAGVRWVRMGTDLPSAMSQIGTGRLSPAAYLRAFRRPLQFALLDADDFLPVLLALPVRLLSGVCRLRSRLRGVAQPRARRDR